MNNENLSAGMKQKGEMQTDADYQKFRQLIASITEQIKRDQKIGIDLLVATGMYNIDGTLKDEFR